MLPQPISHPPSAAAPRLQRLGPADPGRAEVEDFIRAVYARRFAARPAAFAPELLALRDPRDGELLAAAGFRPAGMGRLFLERYLEQPVESLLEVPREAIVEVGHLAARRAGEGRRLILQLAPLLAELGYRWVVCTLTEELRQLFLRLGLAPLALGRADPGRLGQEAADWGRYYEHAPVVLAGSLDAALPALQRRRAQA